MGNHIQKLTTIAMATLTGIFICLNTSSAQAGPINFEFYYADAPGTGFFNPVFGEQARRTLETAGDIWGKALKAAYPHETITAAVKFTPGFTGAGSSEAVGANFSNLIPDTAYPAALINHFSGRDLIPPQGPFLGIPGIAPPFPGGAEMGIQFGSDTNFFFGTKGHPASNQADFLTIALHEIGHGLGFSTQVQSDGTFRGSLNPDGSGGAYPALYDRFVVDEFGTPIVYMTAAERLAAVTDADGIFWSGAQAVAANGRNRPFLMAIDNNFAPGVSVAHFSQELIGRSDLLMDSANSEEILGLVVRAPDNLTLGVLDDMGWRIKPGNSSPFKDKDHIAKINGINSSTSDNFALGDPVDIPTPDTMFLLGPGLLMLFGLGLSQRLYSEKCRASP
jgi:hypothetical protein